MAKCTRCGAKTDPTLAGFCSECGQLLSDTSVVAPPTVPGGVTGPSWPAPGEAPAPPPSPMAVPPGGMAPPPGGPMDWAPTVAPKARRGRFGGRILGSIGARVAIVGVLAGGYGIYDAFVSVDRDDNGAIVDAGDVEANDLAIGDCIDWPDPDAELIEKVKGIPCTESHDAEVFALPSLQAGPDAVFPGFDGLVDEAAGSCISAFEGYVGIAYELDELYYFDFFSPSEESWDAGDRIITCLVYRIDEAKMTASVKATA